MLENPGGEPLNRLIQGPMEMRQFLRFAIGLTTTLSQFLVAGASPIFLDKRKRRADIEGLNHKPTATPLGGLVGAYFYLPPSRGINREFVSPLGEIYEPGWLTAPQVAA